MGILHFRHYAFACARERTSESRVAGQQSLLMPKAAMPTLRNHEAWGRRVVLVHTANKLGPAPHGERIENVFLTEHLVIRYCTYIAVLLLV